MLNAGVRRLKTDFDAMVIANQAVNFSAGGTYAAARGGAGRGMGRSRSCCAPFSKCKSRAEISSGPVVAAPQGLAIGGGCEMCLHAVRIHAASEAYVGLVETGVGLIPAGGGSKEMILRAGEHAADGEDLDLFHAMKPIFENIAMAKVGTSAEESRGLGYLRPADLVSLNRDRLVADAKETALALVRAGWLPRRHPLWRGRRKRRFACSAKAFLRRQSLRST